MGPLNQKMWREFGIGCSKNLNDEALCKYLHLNTMVKHPVQRETDIHRNLFFFADVPHLFKNITQALINNKVIIIPDDIVVKHNLPNNKVDFETVQHLFELQSEFESDFKLTPKLEAYKLKPNSFQKMKVQTSYHVLHQDVSGGLKVVAEETGEFHLLTTAWFIDIVNKWFYLMSSRSPTSGGWTLKNMQAYIECQDFLNEIIYIFTYMKVISIEYFFMNFLYKFLFNLGWRKIVYI